MRGRRVLRVAAGLTAVGGFVADWNRTHLFNPAWPPHARFHDAQTITLSALLGSGGLFFLRRGGDERDLALGALLPALFWVSMGASFRFPGAEGMQAEFPGLVPRVGDVWVDERFASALMLAVGAAGYLAERRALQG